MKRILGAILFVFYINGAFSKTFKDLPIYQIRTLVENYSWSKLAFKREGASSFVDSWVDEKLSKVNRAELIKTISKVSELPNLSYEAFLGALVLESKNYLLVIQAVDLDKNKFLFNKQPIQLTGNEELDLNQIDNVVKNSLKTKKDRISLINNLLISNAFATEEDAAAFRERMKSWLDGYKSDVANRDDASGKLSEWYKEQREALTKVADEVTTKMGTEEGVKSLMESGRFSKEKLDEAKSSEQKDEAVHNMQTVANGMNPDEGYVYNGNYNDRFEDPVWNQRSGSAGGGRNSTKFAYPDGEWAKLIDSALQKYGNQSSFYTKVPKGMEKVCPNFAQMNEADKTKFWVAFMDALSYAESGHNPKDSYKESNGSISAGLYALSSTDSKKGGGCSGLNNGNLTDAAANINCAMEIMNKQLSDIGTLIFSNAQSGQTAATSSNPNGTYYYWSVLSPGLHAAATKGNKRLMDRINYLRSNKRFPEACGSN